MTSFATDPSTTFALGGELTVNRLGYGAMRLTGQPGNFGPYPDWEGGKALLRRAIELGVTFIDTARSYGPRSNERLIAEALHPYPPGLVIATKGGVDKAGPSEIIVDGSPVTLRRQVDDALATLKLERIDLFQLHRVDPRVSIEESLGTLEALRQAGKIRLIGLSNVDREQIDRALAVAPIAAIQNRFNSTDRQSEALIDYTAERGIAFIPHGPLGAHPMQRGAPLAEEHVSNVPASASKPAQRALRWLLDRSPNVIVIPGTTSIEHLEENVGAWSIGAV